MRCLSSFLFQHVRRFFAFLQIMFSGNDIRLDTLMLNLVKYCSMFATGILSTLRFSWQPPVVALANVDLFRKVLFEQQALEEASSLKWF